MGTVFQAIDLDTRAQVAVKVLNGKNASDAARFEQEADLLAELRHPSVVRFIDHGTTAHHEKFIVMEWLEGETLEARLNRGPLSPSLVARIASRVLDGLAMAHARGVVHRDIKPTNIFLTNWRASESKLLDFGVARRTFDPKRLTKKGSTVGTPMYASPEQARADQTIDGRADVFSLGCVLYEALTCEPAFYADTPAAVMTKICAGDPPQVRDRLPDLDPEMGDLLQRILIQDREERAGDAKKLAKQFFEIAERLALTETNPELMQRKPPKRASPRDAISQGEQRIMTVMVLASIGRSGELEPHQDNNALAMEAVPITENTLSRIGAIIEPFGGRLDRLLDRSLVVTAPALGTIDEQAAQVARIALELSAEIPSLAIGIGTGKGVLLARLPAGEVVENAAVLLDGALQGHVDVDSITARLLAARFDLEPANDDGRHRLIAEREGLDGPRRVLDQETAFFGRERELRNLQALYEECVTESVPRIAMVLGQSGIGKTRLCEELMGRLAQNDHHPNVLRGRGIAYHGTYPYVALQNLARTAGISDEDTRNDPNVSLEKFCTWLEAQGAVQPLMIVIEDGHLADASSLHLLDAGLRRLENQPIMVLVLARPEIWDRYPNLFEQRSPSRLMLPPLPRKHSENLLRSLLPEKMAERDQWIARRARGVPYFIEELSRHTISPGRMLLPETVVGVLQAHFDALGGDAKRVLRAASIYGDAFNGDMVAELIGDKAAAELHEALHMACDAGLIERVPGVEIDEFRFPDLLVRECIFLTLSPGDRALGRRLARAYLQKQGMELPQVLQPGSTRPDFTLPEIALSPALRLSTAN